MAKSESIKIVEKHVEKLALVICVLALALACGRWLLGSPTEITVIRPAGRGTAAAPPTKVDDALVKAAGKVRQMYLDSDMANSIRPVPVWVSRLDDLRRMPPLPVAGTQLAMPRRPIPPVEAPGPIHMITLESLAALMPAPAQPVVTASIETPQRDPVQDVVLAQGASRYPLNQLVAAWKDKLPTVPIQAVVPYEVLVEAQQAPADGDWSKAKTRKVSVPPIVDEQGDPIKPEIPDPNDTNIKEVRDARDAIFALQGRILRQSYLPVYRAGAWVDPMNSAADPNAMTFFDGSTTGTGGAYRYRVQLVVVNPLLSYGDRVRLANPDDAKRKFLTSKPSEWSAPVSARREVYFFLTGANKLQGKVVVAVYTRHWGQWVKESFDVRVGESIGGVKEVKLLNPVAGVVQLEPVDFSTGCVAIQLDFRKTLIRRGFKYPTQAMLIVEPDGAVRSRIKAWDDASEKRKELERILAAQQGQR